MPLPFHEFFLNEIRRLAPPNTTLVSELMPLLQLSKANTYKKMNGEVLFSAAEIITLARHFGISLDGYIQHGQGDFGKVMFDYSLPQHQPRTPLLFLEKIMRDLENVARIPNPKIRYASNEVPIFHSLQCRNLLAFKLYVWSRTNWQLPEMLHSAFNPDEFYERWPRLEMLRQESYHLYQQIPTVEYWPRPILNNILNQIRYYTTANLFQNPQMPATLLGELLEMVESREKMAAEGHKGQMPDGRRAAGFDLYLNEIAFTNNIVLIYKGDEPNSLYATMDNPNFVRSTAPDFCQRMHQWVNQIEECSFPLKNEQHRISLFSDLKSIINAKLRGPQSV